MVRLVFRPYTQVGRPICTSGPLRASTRVSPGFALPRHSSPSFGYHRARSCSTSPAVRERRAGDSLVRVSRRVGWVADLTADLGRLLYEGRSPPWRRGAFGDGLRTVRPGRRTRRRRGAPSPPRGGEKARRTLPTAPGENGEVGAGERCKARRAGAAAEPPSPPDPSRPNRSRSRSTAAEEVRPTEAEHRPGGGPPSRGILGAPAGRTFRRVESSGRTVRTPPVYLLTVSRPLELSLQSSFQLSLTVLFTTRFGLHSQTTRLREDRAPAGRGPTPASHRPRAKPPSEGLRPPGPRREDAVFRTPQFPRPSRGTGIRRWALPSSLAATEGILVGRRPRGPGWPSFEVGPAAAPPAEPTAGVERGPHDDVRRYPPRGPRAAPLTGSSSARPPAAAEEGHPGPADATRRRPPPKGRRRPLP
ncbi:hypothetical protein ABG768_015828 [Culter alburnus]|uniref:Uncharacterized protein n=1 Tax=Culter alburnus TaxID=194366 RepID=A0AAW1Z0D3_CULAL